MTATSGAHQSGEHRRLRSDQYPWTNGRLRRHRRRCGLTAALSMGATALIWSVDVGAVALPGPADPGTIAGDVLVDLLVAGARMVASVLLAYLALASMANLVSSFERPRRRAPRLMRWFDRIAPRWLVVASVGIVASSTLSTPAGATEPVSTHDDVVMEVVRDDRARSSVAAETEPGADVDRSPRTMLPWADIIGAPPSAPPTTLPPPPKLEPIEAPASPSDATRPDEPPVKVPQPEPGQQPPPASVVRLLPGASERLHTVQPGEHFWAIAERAVAEQNLEIGVTEYWQRLIDLNRAGLVDPDNPDLIFPGQVLVLP